MATRKTANRALLRQRTASLYDAASERAYRIAQEIVEEIATNPATPSRSAAERATDTDASATPLHLSYYVERQPNGDSVIKSKVRYWVFVEYGTEEHGDAQPHVRPAVDAVRARHA